MMCTMALRRALAVVALIAGGAAACTSSSTPDAPASASPSTAGPTATPSKSAEALPPIDAPGFPKTIYPAPVKGGKAVHLCPSPVGLQRPGRHFGARAVRIAERYQTGPLLRELRAADRAIWRAIHNDAGSSQNGAAGGHRNLPVLSNGPLLGRYTGGGAPNPAHWIRHDCPPPVAERSYEVVIGPRNGPALDGVFVFGQRHSRPLLYFVYP